MYVSKIDAGPEKTISRINSGFLGPYGRGLFDFDTDAPTFFHQLGLRCGGIQDYINVVYEMYKP